MFGWIAGKPDHPLADLKAARQVINELRGGDPVSRLDEATAYLESLLRVDGFRLGYLYEVVDLLDQAAKPHQRRISSDYIGASRLTRHQDSRLWKSAADFWRALAQAYLRCLDLYQCDPKEARTFIALMPVCSARVMRALGAELKWMSLRYGPVPQFLWSNAASAYALAETAEVSLQPLRAYEIAHGDTTVQQEYLKLLVLGAASTDAMHPAQVELAERAIAWFSRSFVLRMDRSDETTHYVDLATQRPPARLGKSVALSPNRRYFGIGKARSEIVSLLRVVKEREIIPDSVRLGDLHPVPLVVSTLEHLLRHLGVRPPARSHEREASVVRLMVAHGYRQVRDTVQRHEKNEPLRPIDIETWVATDESPGGYGATIRHLRGDWVKLGALVGVKPEQARYWGVGVVRRIHRDNETDHHVGVQLLARAALPVELTLLQQGRTVKADVRRALLLSARPDDNGEIDIALEVGAFSSSGRFVVDINGKPYLLVPSQLVEAGDDFDFARFKVRKYEVA
ncbi:MAG: hypothetical protein LXA50_24835 [Betaproteobacteria bacterium]|jgi:hypothetical protein|nr:hypothetical protein [Betaproteobacteria bacterium]